MRCGILLVLVVRYAVCGLRYAVRWVGSSLLSWPAVRSSAGVVVAVWGQDNIALCQKHVSEPLVFLNVAAKYSGELQLNLWSGSMIVAEHPSEKMKALKAAANEEGFAADREQLTSQHISSWDPDKEQEVLAGEVLITSCACLEVGSNDPEASLPQLLQVNGMRLEEPEAGDSVVIGTGERIFFSARARDFSGSVLVGVSQAAALALSGLASKEEFVSEKSTSFVLSQAWTESWKV